MSLLSQGFVYIDKAVQEPVEAVGYYSISLPEFDLRIYKVVSDGYSFKYLAVASVHKSPTVNEFTCQRWIPKDELSNAKTIMTTQVNNLTVAPYKLRH